MEWKESKCNQMKKEKKKDDKGGKCIFLSASYHSKACKLYNPSTKKIVISRDVIFDGKRIWQWNEDEAKQHVPANFNKDNIKKGQQLMVNLQQPNVIQDESKATQNLPTIKERSHRVRRRRVWMTL